MSTIKHPSLKAELLYLVGRATAPLSSADLYERCELADDVIKVSKALNNLVTDGKIMRAPGDGRARYVLAEGIAAPAPAGKAGRSKAVQADDAARGDVLPARVPAAAEPNPALAYGPAPGHIEDSLENLAAAHRAPPEPARAEADARLADAILTKLRPLLRSQITDVDLEHRADPAAPLAIHVHVTVQQIDVHMGGL